MGIRLTNRLLALALAAAAMAAARAETDARPCTNASLQGSYGFIARGTTFTALGLPVALTGAFGSSGSAGFDGAGHFTLTATSSFGGVVQGPATVMGSYQVNADCSYTSSATNGATFRAAIVDGGRELLILQTNTGTAITGVADKRGARRDDDHSGQRLGQCATETMSGSFGFLAEGSAGAPILPGGPFGPLVGVRTLTLSGNGKFNMRAQRTVSGVIDAAPLALTGAYLIGGDCSIQMTFDVGFHFRGAVVSPDEAVFVETDAGSALVVTAKRI